MYKSSFRNWQTQDYDDQFPMLVKAINKKITEGKDDFMLMCVGETGTGKSALMMHAYELYDPEDNATTLATYRLPGIQITNQSDSVSVGSDNTQAYSFTEKSGLIYVSR